MPAAAGAPPGKAKAAASSSTNASTNWTCCNGSWACPRASVRFVQLGRFHNIEVEDNVTAYMEFPDGGHRRHLSPQPARRPAPAAWKSAGEMGKVLLENDRLLFFRNEVSMFQHMQDLQARFSKARRLENRDSHCLRTGAARRPDTKFR